MVNDSDLNWRFGKRGFHLLGVFDSGHPRSIYSIKSIACTFNIIWGSLLFGFLILDKPEGWSSRRTVNSVQRLVRPAKVGHTGTLDPLAQGVLVVCLGPATRLARFVNELPKTYIAEFIFGFRSDSDDTETDVHPIDNAVAFSTDELEAVCHKFLGPISQKPPAYSAIKIDGQRAYKLARKKQPMDLRSRQVMIHSIAIENFNYPKVRLKIECGSGTYIRSLGRDIGKLFRSSAVMVDLVRTSVGDFTMQNAIRPETINATNLKHFLIRPEFVFQDYPRTDFSREQIQDLQHGRSISKSWIGADFESERLLALNAEGELLAIMKSAGGSWQPEINFVHYYLQ